MSPIKVVLLSFIAALNFLQGYAVELKQVTSAFTSLNSPHWDPVTQSLYFVDDAEGIVIRFDPVTNTTTQTYLGCERIGPILTVNGVKDTFILGQGEDLIKFKWDGSNSSIYDDVVLGSLPSGSSFTTGKTDTKGRIWMGVKSGDSNGSGLYIIDLSNGFSMKKVLDASDPNGLEWNKEDDIFYFIDVVTNNVDQFNYDGITIETPGEHFYNTINTTYFSETSTPNGMTVDNSGNLWLGTNTVDVGVLALVNQTDAALLQFGLMNPFVTSAAWGGANLDIMFVTTSRLGLTQDQLDIFPGAGALSAYFDNGVSGFAPNKIVLG